MLQRALRLPRPAKDSFFLWGPRQVGKSSLLRATYPGDRVIDLLRSSEYVRYTQHPGLLADELRDAPAGSFTIIDEIQKVPALLDEIHWLIENRGQVFGLCGSSARKLRRGHANLLGGRATRSELFGLVSDELSSEFSVETFLNNGYLPRHYLSKDPGRLVRAYVDDYLKEEIAAEGLVRNLPAFANFLWAAALADTELVNFTNVARECGVSANAVKEYYQILVDTLLGRFLPAFTRRQKRRVILASKFYFADVGVVNHLARRGRLVHGAELFGKALENFVFHELTAYLEYRDRRMELSYWRLASGIEVDFVVGNLVAAVEVKSGSRAGSAHASGLRQLGIDHPKVGRRLLVNFEARRRVTADGIEVLPLEKFLDQLWSDNLF